jgi:hypothetical protein
MIVFLFIALALLGPLAYFWGADSRTPAEARDKRPWL